ncbi:MAG: 2-oxoacid:acceptor oxidoreductase family protein [Clostridiales bacterium]|nr:2-oxoacid:acceptor oxidoreductase family protein [Clostridiales bacterium]
MIDYSIIIAGFGGQGILSAGKIIAEAALIEGREVSWFPSYGPEMRGGTANCSVVISDEAIGSPVINDADVLIALNQPSYDKFKVNVKKGGIIIIDSSLVQSTGSDEGVRFFPIEASSIANDLGNMAYAPIVLLGCLSESSNCFRKESFEKALHDVLPERRHHMIPNNIQAFERGVAFAEATG